MICAGASFAENFYGMKRVQCRKTPRSTWGAGGGDMDPEYSHARIRITSKDSGVAQVKPPRLSLNDRIWSLVSLVGVPYLKGHMDEYFDKSTGGDVGRMFRNFNEEIARESEERLRILRSRENKVKRLDCNDDTWVSEYPWGKN
jgi:hypothetical protein